MPQDARITAFWELSPGFADRVVLEVLDGVRTVGSLELEPEAIARAAEPAMRAAIVKLGRDLGFTFVALDLAGFSSGSMNQLLNIRKQAV